MGAMMIIRAEALERRIRRIFLLMVLSKFFIVYHLSFFYMGGFYLTAASNTSRKLGLRILNLLIVMPLRRLRRTNRAIASSVPLVKKTTSFPLSMASSTFKLEASLNNVELSLDSIWIASLWPREFLISSI